MSLPLWAQAFTWFTFLRCRETKIALYLPSETEANTFIRGTVYSIVKSLAFPLGLTNISVGSWLYSGDKAGELALSGWATDTAQQLSRADGAVTRALCPLRLRLSRGLLVWDADGWQREKRSIAHLSAFLLVLRQKWKTNRRQAGPFLLPPVLRYALTVWPVLFYCDTVILRVALPGPFRLPSAVPSDWLQRRRREGGRLLLSSGTPPLVPFSAKLVRYLSRSPAALSKQAGAPPDSPASLAASAKPVPGGFRVTTSDPAKAAGPGPEPGPEPGRARWRRAASHAVGNTATCRPCGAAASRDPAGTQPDSPSVCRSSSEPGSGARCSLSSTCRLRPRGLGQGGGRTGERWSEGRSNAWFNTWRTFVIPGKFSFPQALTCCEIHAVWSAFWGGGGARDLLKWVASR